MISRGIFLFTEVEGRIGAAMGAPYHPHPARPFGRKVITGGALLAFASSKIGHCIHMHANPCALAMGYSAINDGTFKLRHGGLEAYLTPHPDYCQ